MRQLWTPIDCYFQYQDNCFEKQDSSCLLHISAAHAPKSIAPKAYYTVTVGSCNRNRSSISSSSGCSLLSLLRSRFLLAYGIANLVTSWKTTTSPNSQSLVRRIFIQASMSDLIIISEKQDMYLREGHIIHKHVVWTKICRS